MWVVLKIKLPLKRREYYTEIETGSRFVLRNFGEKCESV